MGPTSSLELTSHPVPGDGFIRMTASPKCSVMPTLVQCVFFSFFPVRNTPPLLSPPSLFEKRSNRRVVIFRLAAFNSSPCYRSCLVFLTPLYVIHVTFWTDTTSGHADLGPRSTLIYPVTQGSLRPVFAPSPQRLLRSYFFLKYQIFLIS